MTNPLPFKLVRRDTVDAVYTATPTDAEIDDLCRAMWPINWIPNTTGLGFFFDTRGDKNQRDEHRAWMRKLLEHLS